jgi:hypothetical protein
LSAEYIAVIMEKDRELMTVYEKEVWRL